MFFKKYGDIVVGGFFMKRADVFIHGTRNLNPQKNWKM